jgi:hypothetical protein
MAVSRSLNDRKSPVQFRAAHSAAPSRHLQEGGRPQALSDRACSPADPPWRLFESDTFYHLGSEILIFAENLQKLALDATEKKPRRKHTRAWLRRGLKRQLEALRAIGERVVQIDETHTLHPVVKEKTATT